VVKWKGASSKLDILLSLAPVIHVSCRQVTNKHKHSCLTCDPVLDYRSHKYAEKSTVFLHINQFTILRYVIELLLLFQYKSQLIEAFSKTALPLFESGKLVPVVHAVFPLDRIQEAHRMMELAENAGKIVLEVLKEDATSKSELWMHDKKSVIPNFSTMLRSLYSQYFAHW